MVPFPKLCLRGGPQSQTLKTPALDEMMITNLITIHPEMDMNVCPKFHDNSPSSCQDMLSKANQPHGGARRKVRGSPKSMNDHECLYSMSRQSIHLRYSRGGPTDRLATPSL